MPTITRKQDVRQRDRDKSGQGVVANGPSDRGWVGKDRPLDIFLARLSRRIPCRLLRLPKRNRTKVPYTALGRAGKNAFD